MDQDWLEQNMRESLGDYASDLDREAAWTRLEKSRHHRRKRRLFIGFLLAFMLLGSLGYWWWSSNGATSTDYPSQPQQEHIVAQTGQYTNAPAASTVESADPLNNTDSKALLAVSHEQTPRRISANQPTIKTLSAPAKENLPEQTVTTVQPSNQNHLARPSTPKHLQTKPQATLTPTPSVVTRRTPPPSAEASRRRRTLPNSPTPLLPLLPLPTKTLVTHTPSPDPIPYLPKRYLPKKTWWISGTFGYGMSHKQLVAKTQNSENYVGRRAEAEVTRDVSYVSIQVHQYLGRRFFVKSGLAAYQQYDRFVDQYVEQYTEKLDDQLIAIYERADGTTENFFGELETSVNKTVRKTTYNRFQQLTIPVQLGWTLPLGSSWESTFAAGAAYTISAKQKGLIFADETSVGTYLSLADSDYRKRGQWTGLVETNLSYAWNRQVKITVGLQFAASLQSSSLPDAAFSSYHQYLLGTIGLRSVL